MDEVRFDAAKKAKLLRFTNMYSHDPQIPEPEHDLTLLAETPQILRDLMELIAAEDGAHFEEMQKLVAPSPEEQDTSEQPAPDSAKAAVAGTKK